MPWFDFLPKKEYQRWVEKPRFERATESPEKESWLTKAFERFRSGRELAERAQLEPEIPIVEREKPGPREELTREYRSIVGRLRAGEISDEHAEYLWNTAPETVFGNVSAVGLGAGPKLRDIRSFSDLKALGIEAITPVAPPEATEPLGRVPVVGRALEHTVAGLTSPLGLAFTAKFPMLTGMMGAGEVTGATAGRRIAGERGEMIGGLAGALAAPIAGPTAARAALRGARAAPAVGRTALAEAERMIPKARQIMAEEAGGLRLPGEADRFARATRRPGAPTREEALGRWRAGVPAAAPEAARAGVQPIGKEEALSRWRTGLEPTIPNEPPTPPRLAAVGDTPPSMDLWRTLERAHIMGPESDNALRWLAEKASQRGKPIAGLVRTGAAPASVARIDPTRRAGVVYRLMEEVQDTQRMQRMADFRGRSPFKEIGKPGQVDIQGKAVAFADVAENPSKFPLTSQQRQWIEDGWKWIDEWADSYESILGKPIRARVEREHYWPRFAADERGKVFLRTRVGIRESPTKHRLFETMEEGIGEGIPYASPLDSLELYVRSMQKMTRDELLRNVVRVDKIGRAVTPGLRKSIEDAQKAVKAAKTPEAKAAASEKLDQLRTAREAIITPKRGETIGLQIGPGMAGTVFEREVATALKSVIGPGKGWIYPFQQLASVPRMLVTGMVDVGHFFIQGLTLLARSPQRWAETVGRSIQAMAMPKTWLRSLGTRPAARQAAEYGVGMGGTEFTEAARAGGLLRWFPPARVVARGFDSFITEGRIQHFDALASTVVREEGKEGLYRLARYSNTLMGTPSMRGIGISTTQNQFEGAFVFFSPRYTRSIFGTTAYMFGKGVLARDAQVTLGKMLFGGMASFYGLGKALGFSDEELIKRMNPQSRGKFMSLPIGGQEVGLGSAYRATIAFLGSLTVKDNWEFDTWDEAMQQNPLVRYLRSRAAPGPTSTLIDFIVGEDFLGLPVSIDEFITDPRRTLEYASDKFLPLNIEAILEAEGTQEKITAGVVETFGGRSYPRSPYARLEELWGQKRTEMPTEYGVAPANLQDADDLQRRWFYNLPEVKGTRAEQIGRAVERREPWGEFSQERGQAETEFEGRMAAFTGTGQEFRDQYHDFRREWGTRASQQYGEDFERDPRSDMERAADEWWGVGLTYKADGSRDWDAFFAQRKTIEDANPGLSEWLTFREAERWSDPRMKDTVRRMTEADAIADEYFSIPYKSRMPAEQQEQVREYVAQAQSIASMQGVSFRRALMQLGIPSELVGLALRYKDLPINPARERYWRRNPEKKELYYTFYRDIPLGIEEMALAR